MSRPLPYYRAWADVPDAQVEKLIDESRRVGWRAALGDAAVGSPFFGARLGNLLGKLSYAYLVVGGRSATTLLDEQHPFWGVAAALGAEPGPARFASPGHRPGALTIFTHDRQRMLSAVELGTLPEGGSSSALRAAARWPRATELPARLSGAGEFNGIDYRIFVAG
jgi:hypothetical protein